MGRIFSNTPMEGKPLALRGMAKGWRLLEECWERLEVIGGHVEWRNGKNGLIPRIVIDIEPSDGYADETAKSFDITISETTVTIKNCAWQVGSEYFSSADEPSVTATTGTLCAVINRETNEVTAAMDYEWDESTPELIPYAIFDLSVTGSVVTVLLDRRGGMISLHE